METCTPTELASRLTETVITDSRHHASRQVRKIARRLYPAEAVGRGGRWELTPDQQAEIAAEFVRT